MLDRIKAQAGKLEINEIYTQALIMVGIPAIFYIYIDWRAALTAFVITQIILGFLRERAKAV